jgi:hypothetical protein
MESLTIIELVELRQIERFLSTSRDSAETKSGRFSREVSRPGQVEIGATSVRETEGQANVFRARC